MKVCSTEISDNPARIKLLLVRPNSLIERAPPPLGLLAIAAWLRRELPAIEIRIFDGRLKQCSEADVIRELQDFRPDVIGITAMHAEAAEAHAIAALAKRLSPEVRVVMGGPYPTSDYVTAMLDVNLDYAVIGEGELPMTSLMSAFARGEFPVSLAGVVGQSSIPSVVEAGQGVSDLASLPVPAWDLIDLEAYFNGSRLTLENPLQVRSRAVPVMASRGCSYRCIYCHHVFGKQFRYRPVDQILEELELLIRTYGIQEIEFIDDTFNMDMSWAKGFFAQIRTRFGRLPISFSNGIRIDKVDGELLLLMQQAGVYRINYGIESATTRIQKMIGKQLQLSTVRQIVEQTISHGIITGGFFMLGFPTETEEEMKATIDFAVSLPLHTAVFAIATPFPGTELYSLARRTAKDESPKVCTTVGRPSINASLVTNEKLTALKSAAYRQFYFSPARIWRIWRDIPSRRRLLKNGLEVFKVAFFGKELYGHDA